MCASLKVLQLIRNKLSAESNTLISGDRGMAKWTACIARKVEWVNILAGLCPVHVNSTKVICSITAPKRYNRERFSPPIRSRALQGIAQPPHNLEAKMTSGQIWNLDYCCLCSAQWKPRQSKVMDAIEDRATFCSPQEAGQSQNAEPKLCSWLRKSAVTISERNWGTSVPAVSASFWLLKFYLQTRHIWGMNKFRPYSFHFTLMLPFKTGFKKKDASLQDWLCFFLILFVFQAYRNARTLSSFCLLLNVIIITMS